MCEGVAPAVGDLQRALSSGNLAGSSLGQQFGALGEAYASTAAALAPLDPPAIAGGREYATKFVDTLRKASVPLKNLGSKLSAASESETTQILAESQSTLQEATAGMQGFSSVPELESAVREIPACRPMLGGT